MEASEATPAAEDTQKSVFDDVQEGHQPTDAAHDPDKVGPAAAPDPRSLSGDPLSPALKGEAGAAGESAPPTV